jgi:hypothetical protein
MLPTDAQFFLAYQLFSAWQLWIEWVNNVKGGVQVGSERWGFQLTQIEDYSNKDYVVLAPKQQSKNCD